MKKHEMFKHIVAIHTAKNGNVYAGTGFFVKTEENKIYLVTATHVARDTTITTDIWLRNLTTGLPIKFYGHVVISHYSQHGDFGNPMW